MIVVYILTGALICFSRVYLAAHYIHDVVAGAVLALVMLWVMIQIDRRFRSAQGRGSWLPRVVVGLLFLAGVIEMWSGLDPEQILLPCLATFLGFWIGSKLASRQFLIKEEKSWKSFWQGLVLFLIGKLGLLILWQLGERVHAAAASWPPTIWSLFQFLQFFSVGIWITYGALWVAVQGFRADSLEPQAGLSLRASAEDGGEDQTPTKARRLKRGVDSRLVG